MNTDPAPPKCGSNFIGDYVYNWNVYNGRDWGNYGNWSKVIDEYKDTCEEITPDQCLNVVVAVACQKTCKFIPASATNLERPVSYVGQVVFAWPAKP